MNKAVYWVLVPAWLSASYLVLDSLWFTRPVILTYPLTEIHYSHLIISSTLPLLAQTLLNHLLTLSSFSSSSYNSLTKTVNLIKTQSLKLTLLFFCSISTASELKILSTSQLLICTLCFILSNTLFTLGALCDHISNTQFLSFPGVSLNILNTSLVLFSTFNEFFFSFKYSN